MRFERATVKSRKPVNQRKAKAQPALRPVHVLRALHEQLEEARQKLGVDSLAVVGDRELDRIGTRRGAHLDVDYAVLDRVLEQVFDHLLHARRIGVGEGRLALENALKFGSGKPVKLKLEATPDRVRLR